MVKNDFRSSNASDTTVTQKEKTNEQLLQKIREHLENIKKEWNDHFTGNKEDYCLALAFSRDDGIGEERKNHVEEILKQIEECLNDKELTLEKCDQLSKNWNRGEDKYNGENDYGGALLALKSLLDEWKNPPKPTLTPEQEEKLKKYDELVKENEKLRNRQLTENEKKIIVVFKNKIPDSGTLNSRLRLAKRMLNNLEKNDLSVQANPNLAAEGVSLPQCLADVFKQFIWVCELYLRRIRELSEEITELEARIEELERN